jgi:hypothetical protein
VDEAPDRSPNHVPDGVGIHERPTFEDGDGVRPELGRQFLRSGLGIDRSIVVPGIGFAGVARSATGSTTRVMAFTSPSGERTSVRLETRGGAGDAR